MTPRVPLWLALRRPGSGIPGQLTTREGRAVAVTIAPRGDDLLLVLNIEPGDALEQTDDLMLESSSSRGLIRLRGTAERLGDELIRFRAFTEPELVQRREFVRISAPQQVQLDDLCGFVVDAHSVNISGGGMLVAGEHPFEVDEEVRFNLTLDPRQLPVEGRGRIVRSEPGKLGIAFTEISQADRDRLIRFIFDRQRKALAITRGDVI